MNKRLILALILSGAAWGHESGKQAADTQVTLVLSPRQWRVDYRLQLHGAAARAEWAELDADRNGSADAAERSRYLATEGPALGRALELGAPLGPPQQLQVEGNSDGLQLTCSWRLAPRASAWELRFPAAAALDGEHRLVLVWPELEPEAPPAFSAAAGYPVLSGRFRPAPGTPGGHADWTWEHRELNLQSALSGRALWSGLLLSFVLGALHGLTPGHGKSIVGAYLVGSRGTIGQALLLGLVVTFTHTFSVILLGVACLFLFKTYLPPSLIPWIGVASGLLIGLLGGSLLSGRTPAFLHHHHHDDDHEHGPAPLAPPPTGRLSGPARSVRVVSGHDHKHHHHHHHHHVPEKLSLGGLISLGVTGGMVPCPEALAVLLSALALNQLALGLLILLAFSSGLAAVLMTIGIVMVSASRLLQRRYPSGRTIARLSRVSYGFMILMGLAITLRNLWETGLFS